MTLLLTPDELSALTGAKQAKRQRVWLSDHGIPYREGAAGRPLVSRAAVERWLSGVDAKPSRGPNLALVT
jgi:transposase InsO family protein